MHEALCRMKEDKAVGTDMIMTEMLKAGKDSVRVVGIFV